MPKDTSYSGEDIQVLEGLEAVARRPGMYIGNNASGGLSHLTTEIIANSVDEAIAGYCSRIEITFHEDGSVEVEDNGRGIPVDTQKQTGLSALEVIFTVLHAGGKFGGKGYAAAGGLHGVGASVVNALSNRVQAIVYRDGKKYEMNFHKGIPGVYDKKGNFTKKSGVQTVGTAPKNHTGTKVRFWPNMDLFTPDARTDVEMLTRSAQRTAFLVPNLALQVRDLRDPKNPKEELFKYSGGVKDMVEFYNHGKSLCDPVHLTGSGTYMEKIPMADEKGHMRITEVERTVNIDIAFQWNTGYDENIHTFVNVVSTPHGGTHQEGFKRGLLAALRKGYDGTRIMKQNEDPVTWDDVTEGLTAVISVSLPEPQFVGQTKEELGTPGVTKAVQEVTAQGVKAWLEGRKKTQARQVLEKVANAARTRVSSRTQREAARRKTALEGASMPPKLVDCRTTGVARSELLIVEGDSALGSARAARNSEYQALLPIRGKILNVQKASLSQILANAECTSIIQVIGAGSGRTFDLEQMRYHKVILMSVPGDESVLVSDSNGFMSLRQIGPFVDGYLHQGVEVPDAVTASLDVNLKSSSVAPIKKVIRHRFQGTMRNIETRYGRSIRVTDSHSLFTWENGEIVVREAGSLKVGDIVVAPRRIPRAERQVVELDIVHQIWQAGLGEGLYVWGDMIADFQKIKSAEKRRESGGAKYGNDPRVVLDKSNWEKLSNLRSEKGLTQKQVAHALGYAQPITVSQWERGNIHPPVTVFERYLELIGAETPTSVTYKNSFFSDLLEGHEDSAHARHRVMSGRIEVPNLDSQLLFSLGRNTKISVRGQGQRAVQRHIPVNEAFCELLGWLSAEGTISSRGRISLALGKDDESQIPYILNIIKSVTGLEAKVATPKKSANNRHLYFDSVVFARLFIALGTNGTASDKKVPDLIFNVDESCQLAYLRGVYLGDGTKSRSVKSMGNLIIVSTVSSDLANGVSYVLSTLGVPTVVSKHEVTEENQGDGPIRTNIGTVYSLSVGSRKDVERLRAIWDRSAYSHVVYEWLSKEHFSQQRNIIISDTLMGLPITGIVDEEVDQDVYDFSVADHESFVAGFGGGLMAHNSDADVDGSHIRSLLIVLACKLFRPMVEAGRLYTAVPPLFKIETTGRNKETIYAYSKEEMEQLLVKLEKAGKNVKTPVSRFKGLGEMNAEELWDTTLNPEVRTLRQITMGDLEESLASLELVMGDKVEPRRDWIIRNADKLSLEDLDL